MIDNWSSNDNIIILYDIFVTHRKQPIHNMRPIRRDLARADDEYTVRVVTVGYHKK